MNIYVKKEDESKQSGNCAAATNMRLVCLLCKTLLMHGIALYVAHIYVADSWTI